MSRPSLGSSVGASSPAPASASAAGASSRRGRPSLAPRKSLIALRQAATGPPSSPAPPTPALPGSATPYGSVATPKRASLSHSVGAHLDIGDLVSIELPGGTVLTGVLRHLGPVHFKDGIYAGLELVGDSEGKGKNNGEVQGRQYFATQPNNGMFCLASKVVKLSQQPATDAVARPESALSSTGSQHSSHSRSASRLSRPASRISLGPSNNAYTPVRSNMRPRSNTTSSHHPSEPSTSRPSSRVSTHHDRTASESNAGLNTPGAHLSRSTATPAGTAPKLRTPSNTATTPTSKLPFSGRRSFGFGGAQRGSTPAAGASAVPPVPRPPSAVGATAKAAKSRASSRSSSHASLDDDPAEADSERRAKSSAEAAARAEKMISVGSRAHRFLGLRGRDLHSQAQAKTAAKDADEVFGDGGGTNGAAKTRAGTAGTPVAGRTSPTKGRPSSPLKATLLGRPSLGGGTGNNTPQAGTGGGLEALRRARASLPSGSSGLPASSSSSSINNTPRPAKGRASMFSQGNSANAENMTAAAAAMPPPPSPSKLGGPTRLASGGQPTSSASNSPTRLRSPAVGTVGSERSSSVASGGDGQSKFGLRSPAASGGGPQTPVRSAGMAASRLLTASPSVNKPLLRPSLGSQSSASSFATALDESATVQEAEAVGDQSLVRRHRLLEEMDLTPKRSGQAPTTDGPDGTRSLSRLSVAEDRPLPPASPGSDFIAQASVPLSLYEEVQAEVERLTSALSDAEQKAAAERANRTEEDRVLRVALDEERARVKEEKEEWEEERRMFRSDEERRKREAENRERELKEALDKAKREIDGFKDLPKSIEALKAELNERDRLIEELKRTIEQRDQGKAEESGKIRIVEAELKRAEEKLKRVEADHASELVALQKEIDDLKAAGTEMAQLFDVRVQEVLEETREEIENEFREDLRKTLRDLAAVEAERDALISKREAEDQQRSLAHGRSGSTAGMPATAITIENESLREQVSHLQEKVGSLEEELALANMQADNEREAVQQKQQRAATAEATLKAEIKKLKAELERVNKEERAARQRIEELAEVVDESKTALETERAEVERLRADLLGSAASGLLTPATSGANSSGGATSTPTLQDEAMQERARRAEADKAKLETEVERLKSLLEGARSGKKEAVRLVEEYKKNADDNVELIEDVRRELSNAEAEKAALELRVAQLTKPGSEVEGSAVLVRSLRRTIDDKNKEVEMLKKSHLPLSDQLLELRKIHSDEMAGKEEELRRLRASLASAKAAAATAKKVSEGPAGVASAERRALTPVVGQQPSNEGELAHARESSVASTLSKEHDRPVSIASNNSRTSLAGPGSPDLRSDPMVANQMSGLNYLVRQLTDENAKFKSQYRLLEQEAKEAVEKAKNEARVSALTLESLQKDVKSLQSGGDAAVDLVSLRTEFSQRTAALERQVQEGQAELAKLQAVQQSTAAQHKQTLEAQAKEISDLEHLVESQIYKLDEKEETCLRLQRRLDHANAHIEELRARLEPDSPEVAIKTPPGTKRSTKGGADGGSSEEENSPSFVQALRLGKIPAANNHSSSTLAVPASNTSKSPVSPQNESFTTNGHSTSSLSRSDKAHQADEDEEDEEDLENFCVLCNVSGHSVVNCTSDLVSVGAGPSVRSLAAGANGTGSADDEDEVCDDCGEKGHKLEECPYADVF